MPSSDTGPAPGVMVPPLGKMPGNGPTPVLNRMSSTMPSQNSGMA